MFALFGRLFVLRPLLGVAILGIPVLALIAVGLAAVVVLKVLLFFVLPAVLIFWLLRRVFKPHDDLASPQA